MAKRSSPGYSGDLQAEVMACVWQLDGATVEDVRNNRPSGPPPGYTTVQTVMNRLVERGLLERERHGKTFVYKARFDEAAYVAARIGERLDEASPDARRAALVALIDGLKPDEIDEIARLTARIKRRRGGR